MINARKIPLVAAVLSLLLVPLGCEKKEADTVPPGSERGGAGADGNNSAPDSLSNGGADPETTPLTEPSTATPDPATGTPDAASATPPDATTPPSNNPTAAPTTTPPPK